MALTKSHNRMVAGSWLNVIDFGAVGDGAADDTPAIQAAIDAALAASGTTIIFPRGVYLVTGLTVSWGSSGISINFKGSGKNNTEIRKTGASSAAVFDLTATLGDGSFSVFEDMHVVGSASCDGFSTTNIARSIWRNVKVTNCDVAIENQGSLINSFYDCDLLTSSVGYRARKSSGIYCNLIQFYGGSIRGNSQWGFDIGDTSGLHLHGVDVENNGTSGGTGGGFITRSTCDDEIGFSTISVNGCWFEGNFGTSLYMEACAGLTVSVSDTMIIQPESGAAITCDVIGKLTVDRITAGSSGDTVAVSASAFAARQSVINVLSDNSGSSVIENVSTAAGTTQFSQKSPAGDFVVTGEAVRSDTGLVATTSGVASNIFSPTSGAGLYQVYANIDLVGSAYMATALISFDGSSVFRIDGVNGANLSISVAGATVQVTQTSGAPQTVRFSYLKIGAS